MQKETEKLVFMGMWYHKQRTNEIMPLDLQNRTEKTLSDTDSTISPFIIYLSFALF